MKAIRARHESYEASALDETEFALAISPCPKIDAPNEPQGDAQDAARRSERERSRQAFLREDELTETLTIGWGIALAMAVALVVYVSGG